MNVQAYARTAGALMLVSVLAGFFGEMYVPSRLIVSGDPAATAAALAAHESLFRVGFAAYLLEAVCDVILSLLFFVLLRPVNRNLALLAAFFGLVSTSLYAVAEFCYFAASLVPDAPYLGAFSPEQRAALAYFFLRLYATGGAIFMAFYGTASLLRGWLIYCSGYLPRLLGALLMIAGLGFIARTITFLLAPAYSSELLLLPMAVAGVSLLGWLLFKGVNEDRWVTP